MGASCTITSVCGLAQEARQYTNDENFILNMVALTKSSNFRRAVEESLKMGREATVTYHKDGSPTYRSVLQILKLENSLSETGLNTIPLNELDELNGMAMDTKAIFNNKLVPIANRYGRNFKKSEGTLSINGLSYDIAIDIATTFNLQNAVSQSYIVIVEKQNLTSYRVKIVENTRENREKMEKKCPKYAAIQAAVDFFESMGIKVYLDQFNPDSTVNEFQVYDDEKAEQAANNDIAAAISTVIAICTNLNRDDISDLPTQISRNVAVMAANIFIEAAQRNPEFRESIGYQRLYTATQRYLNQSKESKDEATVEKVMRLLIADEIQERINLSIKAKSDELASSNRMLKYVRQRIKSMFEKIKEAFYKNRNLIEKWKQDNFLNKTISIKELQRVASRAVNEMFQEKTAIENAMTMALNPIHRQNLKKYTNLELKELKIRHSKTQKLLINIESRLKVHLKLLVGQRYTKESTRFETIMDDLENAFVATNTVGAVTSQKDVASKALTRTVIQLNYELLMLANDINALNVKMQNIVPDYTNEEYMDNVQQLLMLYSRYLTLCEIKDDIIKGLENGLLNPKVKRLGTNGIEESNLKALIEDLNVPMTEMKKSFEAVIDKVNLDLLEQMVGTQEMNMVIGKMFKLRKQGRGRTHETYADELKKISTDGEGRYFETRSLLKEQLENPANLRNSLWHRIMGSPQNSSSILNQVAYLAINRANIESHNRTQLTLYDIIRGRRLYKRVSQKNIIERDANGVPTGNLIRPIDYDRYEKELEAAEKMWGEEFAEKYKNRDFTYDQRAILWKGFRLEKFNEWNQITNENTGKPDFRYKKQEISIMDPHTGEVRKVDIYAPNMEIYRNYEFNVTDSGRRKPNDNSPTRWDNLTREEQELSNWFFSLKYISDNKLDGQGSGYHKIPMFKGGKFDTFWGLNVTHLSTLASNTLKRSFLQDIEDYEYGAPKVYTPLAQRGYRDTDEDVNDRIKRIPLYGIRKLDNMDALSTDLYSSYLAYEDMSNNYAAKSKVELLLLTTATKAYRSLRQNDSDRIAEKTKWYEGHTFRHEFEHFIDKELYGLKKNDITLGTLGIRLAKVMNHLGRLTTTLFLGGNIHSSFINLVTGYNEIVKEAGVGEYINKSDLIKAMYNYTHHVQFKKLYVVGNKNAPGFMPYLLRLPAESPGLVNQILRDFDFTERFVLDIRQYTTKNVNKIARNFGLLRLIMMPYEVTDHWMQAVPLIAMLHHEKVYSRADKDGTYRLLTLMEALYPEYHKFGKRDAKKSYGYRRLVQKPDYIDTGNRFGIFYKTKEDAEKGENLLKLLEEITANITNYYSLANYSLRDLAAEDPKYKEIFEEYGLTLPTTIKQFEDAKAELVKKFDKLIYNNAELAKFQLKAREVVNRMHGVYDSRSKGAFNRTLLGATMLSMKNYAVGLVNKRLMLGHYNIILNKWDEGTLVTVSKVLTQGVADAWRDYGFWSSFQTILALVSPYMFKNARGIFSGLNLAENLIKNGFSESQVTNLKRAKLDALRILFWGIINGVIYGLGSGWIGGYDDDDDEKALSEGQLTELEKMLGLKGGTRKITRQSILDGSAFEEGGGLHSEVTPRSVFKELGIDVEDIENHPERIPHNNTEELEFIKEYIIPHLDDVFEGYGDKGGLNAQIDKWYTEWCDKDPKHRRTKDGNRGWGRGKGHSIFPNAFEAMMKDKLGEGSGKSKKLPKTIILNLKAKATGKKKELDNLVLELENMKAPSTLSRVGNWIGEKTGIDALKYSLEERNQTRRKNELQERILHVLNQLTTIDFIKTGYNKHIASKLIRLFKEREQEFLKEYGVASINELRAKLISTSNDPDAITAANEVRKFLEDYDATEKRLSKAEKSLRNREFETAYFKNNHPNLYYWLGVANYVAERSLLEQESFIPFADLLAREGGTYIANQIGHTAGTTEWMTKVIPELTHCEPIRPLEYKYNEFNELANLIGLPALTGSLTSASTIFTELGNYLFQSEEGYNKELDRLKDLRDSTADRDLKLQLQYEIDELERDWEKHHVQNNSAKLKKGQHKAVKGSSFIPYYRTLYMMGFFNYLDNTSLEGGWQAANSFKSFFYKEDRLH